MAPILPDSLTCVFTLMSSCGPWEANCYLVGATDSDECVVVDAGMDATAVVERLLSESNRTPVAVLATHGHLDHVADAHTVADAYGIPVWIHPADRHLLSDPAAGLSPQAGPLVTALYGSETLPEPADVREWVDADSYDFAGLRWTVSTRRVTRRAACCCTPPLAPSRACFPGMCCSPGRSVVRTCLAARCETWPPRCEIPFSPSRTT